MRSCVYHLNPLNLPEWRSLCWWCGGPSKVHHGTSMSCDVHHQMPPSCEVSGFEHVRFFSTATCNTLWLQDTSGLWDTIGHRSLAFTSWLFFQFRSISNHQVQVPKKCSTHFWMLTPLSNNQHTFQQKMCIKNPTQSANLHHLRHGFGHSHDGSLCPRICRIKGAILKAVRRFRTWKTHKSCSGFYSCWNFGCFVTHFWDLDGNYGLTSWQKLNIWPQETRQGMDFHLLS